MTKLSDEALKQLFTEARTFTHWQKKDVSNQTLQELYDLMKFGPTSANGCPVRIAFIKSEEEKNKLLPALSPLNVEKVKSAPVTAIIAMDEQFYEQLPKLYPTNPTFKNFFSGNKAFADATAFRNSSLQGAYFILAARALGLDCGPMSGFDNAVVDHLFFQDSTWKSNFICNIGYGDREKLHPRNPRLSFNEACIIL